MDAIGVAGSWNGRHINDKVAYLSIENISRNPVWYVRVIIAVIFVAINEAVPIEVGCCFDNWEVGRVTNQVGEILVNNRTRNQVSSSWEVDSCRSCRGRFAKSAAPTSRQDGIVNCRCVVRDTVTCGTLD